MLVTYFLCPVSPLSCSLCINISLSSLECCLMLYFSIVDHRRRHCWFRSSGMWRCDAGLNGSSRLEGRVRLHELWNMGFVSLKMVTRSFETLTHWLSATSRKTGIVDYIAAGSIVTRVIVYLEVCYYVSWCQEAGTLPAEASSSFYSLFPYAHYSYANKYQKWNGLNWSEVKWSAVNVYTIIFSNYVLRWEYCLVISLV